MQHTHTHVLSRLRSRYRSACDRSANAPLYPHSLYPRVPDSLARSEPTHSDARFTLARHTLSLPGVPLSLPILTGLTLARPALAPPAIAPPAIVRCVAAAHTAAHATALATARAAPARAAPARAAPARAAPARPTWGPADTEGWIGTRGSMLGSA